MKKKQAEEVAILAGRKPVREAVETSQPIEKIWLLKTAHGEEIDKIRGMASRRSIPLQHVPSQRLDRLAPGVNHQGVVATVSPIEYLSIDDLLASIGGTWGEVQDRKPVLLVLDQIEDPHNVGAMLRSACAVGAAGVIVTARKMAPINAATMKASAGAARRVPIARTSDLAETLYQLKERGYWIVGADHRGEATHWEAGWEKPVVIVMGSEQQGIRPAVLAKCDQRVAIPMPGDIESLNVSVAAALLLFEAARARHQVH